jgi:MinD superfamily P-loop ATPase
MRIAVASGKGGTGKTTIAVSLLLTIAALEPPRRPKELIYLDCDVEEPNAHLFLRPTLTHEEPVGVPVPEVRAERCTHCGTCAEVCVFNAISVIGNKVLVFPQLCHGCGSCTYNCPTGAIRERLRPTGTLDWGVVPGTRATFGRGTLNVGEAMATPVIKALKDKFLRRHDALVLLDAPPGTSCPVVETVRDVDFVLLVTEPTPFGLHDLRGAVEVARGELGLPVGVVINRTGVGDEGVEGYCATEDVPVLLRVPLDRRIAATYAEGVPLVRALPEYHSAFEGLYAEIESRVAARRGVET